MQAARRAARPCARHPTAPSGHAAPPRRTRPARFMPAGKEGNGSRSAPINTIDALQAVPEFERVLPAGAASSCAAAFALDAHARLLRAASLRLAGASGGEALGAARTAFSDDAGRFVRRSKDGGMVIHAQTMTGDALVDWAHQSFGLGAFGLYSKTSLFLRAGAGSLVPLTPHLEMEIFAPPPPPPPTPAAGAPEGGDAAAAPGSDEEEEGEDARRGAGGGSAGEGPLLFYLNMAPRASLALYPAYLDRYYTTAPPPPPPAKGAAAGGAAPAPLPSWAQLEAACAGDPLFSRFTSPSLHIRAFSPTAILFNVDSETEGRAAVLDVVEQAVAIWGAWLAADVAAGVSALADAGAPAGAPDAPRGAALSSADRAARGAAAAAACGWLLGGAPAEAGGVGAALLAEAPALDAATRRFPWREPAAAALKGAFGAEAMEAWWATVDGSARVA